MPCTLARGQGRVRVVESATGHDACALLRSWRTRVNEHRTQSCRSPARAEATKGGRSGRDPVSAGTVNPGAPSRQSEWRLHEKVGHISLLRRDGNQVRLSGP